MPRVRPTAGLHNLGRNPAALKTRQITTCKLCGQGVFQGQEHRWLRRPAGLSHDDCAQRAGLLEETP